MDLLSSRPFWPMRDGLPAAFPPLERNRRCDVAVVGAGITGAMIAAGLAEANLDVVVLDRREVAHGSTAGNTGLLLYELDVPMTRLARRIGRERAVRAYARCREAVQAMRELVRDSQLECEFKPAPSLYLAASAAHVAWLEREFAMRRAAGHDIEWWGRKRLRAESSLPHQAAILSRDSAQLDAYCLTYGLLLAAQRRGAEIYDRTAVIGWHRNARGVRLRTSRGGEVRARHVVVATGYEAEAPRSVKGVALQSTFVLATEPVAACCDGWPLNDCLMWDTGNPYLYLRTTADRRIIIGGYDEPFRNPELRDRMLGAKVAALKRRLTQFFPRLKTEVATAWAGTFGVSDDGLPVIGRHPKLPRTWFALGFGGNGTTFSRIAADIIRGELTGQPDPDAELFGFGRLSSRRPSAGSR